MGEHLPCKQGVKSSNLFISTTTSEWTLLHSDFSLQKNQSYASSFLLFPKKQMQSLCFLGSLLSFCGFLPLLYPTKSIGFYGNPVAPSWRYQLFSVTRRRSSFFAKSHARLNCSLVNALATFHCRYHLFASALSAFFVFRVFHSQNDIFRADYTKAARGKGGNYRYG